LIGEIALTADPTAQPFAGAACEAGMLKRPKNKAISDAISILCIELPPSGHPLKAGVVRETKHRTAFQSSGHSMQTKDFYNRLSFLNAATEKPGQNTIETAIRMKDEWTPTSNFSANSSATSHGLARGPSQQ
jgi:hypothetical protein